MVKKNNKVTRELFSSVLKNGSTYHSPHFSFRIGTDDIKRTHIAFAVPKKIVKRAVVRNKIKRRGYYTLHTLLPDIKKSFTGIFFVKNGAEALPYKKSKEEIISLLYRAKLF